METTIDSSSNSDQPASALKIGAKYGAISTIIGIAFFLVLSLSGGNPFDNTWGWIRIVISIVLLVLAQNEFKKEGDGFMSYGKGFQVGAVMTIVGVILGNLFTLLYVNVIDPTVMEVFYDAQRAGMEEKNMPDEQIDVALEWTRKLFWYIAFIFGIIGGLIGTLIVTIFTQKKNPEAIY